MSLFPKILSLRMPLKVIVYLRASNSWDIKPDCLWFNISVIWQRKRIITALFISFSQSYGANLPFEQLLTYCPTASGLWNSDVSHVLSLIFKGPSRSLPLQDLKDVKASAKGLFFSILKFKNSKLTLQLKKCNFFLKTLINRTTKVSGHSHGGVVLSPIIKFEHGTDLPEHDFWYSFVISINEYPIQASKNKWISNGLEKDWLIFLIYCTYDTTRQRTTYKNHKHDKGLFLQHKHNMEECFNFSTFF